MYYDLHIHTNESDGKYSKIELLRYFNKKGVEVVAFCDHNNCNNVDNKKICEEYYGRYKEQNKTKIIPAVEIDADNDTYRRIHILGYGMNKPEIITKRLSELKQKNVEATKIQIQKINQIYGTDISVEFVEKIEGSHNISVQSLKIALIKLALARDMRDTYRFVCRKSPTHVNRHKIKDIEVIKLIHLAGGVAILAHPIEISRKDTGEKIGYDSEYEKYLRYLILNGLDGVESHTIKHSNEEQKKYWDINKKYDIISTAGTDFHDEIRTPRVIVDYDSKMFLSPLIEKIKEVHSKNIERENEFNDER